MYISWYNNTTSTEAVLKAAGLNRFEAAFSPIVLGRALCVPSVPVIIWYPTLLKHLVPYSTETVGILLYSTETCGTLLTLQY